LLAGLLDPKIKQRSSILPFGVNQQGGMEPVVPQTLVDLGPSLMLASSTSPPAVPLPASAATIFSCSACRGISKFR